MARRVKRAVTSFRPTHVATKTRQSSPSSIQPSIAASVQAPCELMPRHAAQRCRVSTSAILPSSRGSSCAVRASAVAQPRCLACCSGLHGQTSADERRGRGDVTLVKRPCQERDKPVHHRLPVERGHVGPRLPPYLVQRLWRTRELHGCVNKGLWLSIGGQYASFAMLHVHVCCSIVIGDHHQTAGHSFQGDVAKCFRFAG